MRLTLGPALLSVAALAGSFAPLAHAADAPVAVLGLEAAEGAPDALAAAITDALRRRVSSTKGMRLVPGRDLLEVKLVFSCPDEAPSCMAQAGKSLGAQKLIFGSVKKSAGETFVVTLKLLDTQRGVVETWTAEQINKAQASDPAIRGPVQKWFATLTGQGAVGVVRVRGDVIGAAVALDGTPSGTLGTEDLVLPGVTAGKHEIVVSKEGYETVRREVNVGAGETAQVDVTLPKVAVAAPPPAQPLAAPVARPDEPPAPGAPADRDEGGSRTGLKTATWAVLGAGVASLALGVKFGLDVKSINDDLDPYRRFACSRSVSPSGVCDANDRPAQPLNREQQNYVDLKKEDGERLETYQFIALGAGAALVATGGYLFYRAYLAEDDAASARAPGARTALLPYLTPTGGGVGLLGSF